MRNRLEMDKIVAVKRWPILLFFFPVSLLASPLWDDIQVIRDPNRNIILTAKCNKIENKIEGLIDLNWKIDQREPEDDLVIYKRDKGLCSVDVTTVVPERILDLPESFNAHSGPNCWNTSLFTNKVNQFRRFTSEDEMSYWMSSPLCRELREYEREKPGDIIAIRINNSENWTEFHGFVYLTADFSFSKNSFSSFFPYELTSSEYVYQIFALGDYGDNKVSKKCRKVEGKPDISRCPVFANVFRCHSYQHFFDSVDFKSKQIYQKWDLQLLKFEKKLSEAVVMDSGFTLEKGLILRKELTALQNKISPLVELHKKDSVLWESLQARIKSFQMQIDLLLKETR